MPNMSYCRFENTANDMQDCLDALCEAESFEDMELSDSEQSALDTMLEMCQTFTQAFSELQERST